MYIYTYVYIIHKLFTDESWIIRTNLMLIEIIHQTTCRVKIILEQGLIKLLVHNKHNTTNKCEQKNKTIENLKTVVIDDTDFPINFSTLLSYHRLFHNEGLLFSDEYIVQQYIMKV